MSHFIRIKTQIKDRRALVRALERMGLKGRIEQHETAKRLTGYDQSVHMAHVIVRQQYINTVSRYNDLGFELEADGTYTAHMADVSEDWRRKFLGYYGIEKAKSVLDQKGLDYYETEDENHVPMLKIPVEL